MRMYLLTQRSGAQEDSPGRLPPSSSSVLYRISFLHGSQLLTCFIMIHQPNVKTQTHERELMVDTPRKMYKILTYRWWILNCYGCVCVCVSAVHVRGEWVVVLVVLPVVTVALIVCLFCWPLASPDDWQPAVTRVRATSRQTSKTTKRANRQT